MFSDGVKRKLRAFCPVNSLPTLFFIKLIILLVIILLVIIFISILM